MRRRHRRMGCMLACLLVQGQAWRPARAAWPPPQCGHDQQQSAGRSSHWIAGHTTHTSGREGVRHVVRDAVLPCCCTVSSNRQPNLCRNGTMSRCPSSAARISGVWPVVWFVVAACKLDCYAFGFSAGTNQSGSYICFVDTATCTGNGFHDGHAATSDCMQQWGHSIVLKRPPNDSSKVSQRST